MDRRKVVALTVLLLCLATFPCFAGQALDLAKSAQQRANEYRGNLTMPDIAGPSSEEAAKTYNLVQSPEFQEKVKRETDRIGKGVFGASPSEVYANYYKESGQTSMLAADERIYVFVSSSVPIETVRAYAADLHRLNAGSIVLRGFVGGARMLQPTITYIASVTEKQKGCVDEAIAGNVPASTCTMTQVDAIVDPNLFRRYQIDRVPAVVFARGIKPGVVDASEGDDSNTPMPSNWWVVYGDVSLGYSLDKIGKAASSQSLIKLAGKIGGNGDQ